MHPIRRKGQRTQWLPDGAIPSNVRYDPHSFKCLAWSILIIGLIYLVCQ